MSRLERACLVIDHDDTAVMSTPEIHYPAHVEALRRLRPGREPIGLEGWLRKNFDPGLTEYLSGEIGLSGEELGESYRIWREFTGARVPEFFPGMFEFLVEFRCRGGLVVVVSHSEVDMIERDYRAASAGLAEAFLPDLVFGWDVDPARRKPSPYPVLAALERFGLPASEALVLDDLKPGLDMAASAGVDCAAAGWGHAIPEIREVMANRCRWYFDTVAEFAGFILGA